MADKTSCESASAPDAAASVETVPTTESERAIDAWQFTVVARLLHWTMQPW
jgi:hypothetical protein